MRLRFTKMQGAGNDFVVLDGTRTPLALTPAQLQRLGDRRFGVGADQILAVERSTTPGVDFRYRIFNGASGDEVEHCGNGARCFVRYVHEHGLTDKTRVRVETVNNLLELQLQPDGRVTVDMNRPVFDHDRIPFDASGLAPRRLPDEISGFELWPLEGVDGVELAVLSMGNPHAVLRVADVDAAAVADLGPRIETHARFARHVNVGFLQVLSRGEVRLRVHERDAGETLACGTGACAAVVAGIRLGWLDRRVELHARGGDLLIEWPALEASVLMTGPAQTVFEGEIEL
ncbi:diaminopimelate epimerase [Rubrivivax sp. A210]|uniref:diaminopimelate epimerase n=1 Tax=Rubrivivax sp. A210 TaxID=2772301 RepID=UPI001917E6A2|nr:diaminopimelate epimerase [Rubrivivax sp. A210]CAD5374217.1 diaminopimelate epimerase [Rubrivivax sp. A210]